MARKRKREELLLSEDVEEAEKGNEFIYTTNGDLTRPQPVTDLNASLHEIYTAFTAPLLLQQPLLDGETCLICQLTIEKLSSCLTDAFCQSTGNIQGEPAKSSPTMSQLTLTS
jgi:hypothetical protein